MSKEGWIALHRKLQDNNLWTCEPFSKGQAWVDLLLMANHEEKRILVGNQYITVSRGERFCSLENLSARWKWSLKKVRNFLKLLEDEEMIAKKGQAKGTLLTIVNYDFYQNEGQAKDTFRGKLGASSGQTKGKQRASKGQQTTMINNDITMSNNDETMSNNTCGWEDDGLETDAHDYTLNSNYENVVYFLNNNEYEGKQYLKDNQDLWKAIAFWLHYKDDRAKLDKINWGKHHYKSARSIQALLSQIINNSKQYGVDATMKAIETSVGREYQGILWEQAKRKSEMDEWRDA